MTARTRITLLFTGITAAILLVFAAVIYFSAKENRELEFYSLLNKEAITKANLFLNAHVDKKTLQDIYHNNRQILNEVEVAIYDSNFNLLYHDAVDIDFVKETKEMIDQINQQGEIRFYQEGWQVLGVKHLFEDRTYIIVAAAYDEYGYNKLSSLLHDSLLILLFSIAFLFFTGRFFSKKVFDPLKKMSVQAKQISANKLNLRLPTSGNKDELDELSATFNAMLNRLESSFDAQKHFVSNIAHELRTPLAAIIAELELAEHQEKTAAEYKKAIADALSDAQKLARLSNSLLDLAKASYDPSEITFKQVRLDEVLLDAIRLVQRVDREYRVEFHFEQEFEDDRDISIQGNEYLLKVAFINLIENACKFSAAHKATVTLQFDPEKISLVFADSGIGISETDLPHIFSPFYRGSNERFTPGNGIGLSLTQKIVHLHNGDISVQSKVGKGSNFHLRFYRLNSAL
ncbi:MAG: ATP-binding protein [Sphingobacterium hotanense]